MKLEHPVWVQPSMTRRFYELHADNEIPATLEWKQLFGTLAEANTWNGNWTFERIGFWKPRICVRENDEELALFLPRTFSWNGTLKFRDGREFLWNIRGFWKQVYTWKTPDGLDLIHFQGGAGILKFGSQVEVQSAASTLPELPLLLCLGFYLMMIISYATTAAISTSTATATS